MKKKVCLMILDGWGNGKNDSSNAIYVAQTPFIDGLEQNASSATLKTYGENVGLPEGQMGNSEVGHMNIGAGRIVYQDLVRINLAIRNGSFFEENTLLNAMKYAKSTNVKVHLLGLVSNGGVHSSQEHLHALLDMTKQQGLTDVFVHAFSDGRDTDPHSGKTFMKSLIEHCQKSGGKVASICGRYYAMDRDKRWERVKQSYDLMVHGIGIKNSDPLLAIEQSYNQGITDEFVEPHVITDSQGKPLALIEENDVVIVFNFRTDRCREITQVLTQEDFPEFGMNKLHLHYVTFTNYDNRYKNINVVFDKQNLDKTLGEVVSDHSLSQLRIAETEKYPHVSFFFSGGREALFPSERRIMINSPKVATYDLQPEMSAYELSAAVIDDIEKNAPDFICLNFANPDMVGHTGVFSAIVKACETIDVCAKKVAEACLNAGYVVLITADHGNADYAINADGSPNTAHSMNLVPLHLLGSERKLISGVLADLAPTVLELFDIAQPIEMTGKSLLI